MRLITTAKTTDEWEDSALNINGVLNTYMDGVLGLLDDLETINHEMPDVFSDAAYKVTKTDLGWIFKLRDKPAKTVLAEADTIIQLRNDLTEFHRIFKGPRYKDKLVKLLEYDDFIRDYTETLAMLNALVEVVTSLKRARINIKQLQNWYRDEAVMFVDLWNLTAGNLKLQFDHKTFNENMNRMWDVIPSDPSLFGITRGYLKSIKDLIEDNRDDIPEHIYKRLTEYYRSIFAYVTGLERIRNQKQYGGSNLGR